MQSENKQKNKIKSAYCVKLMLSGGTANITFLVLTRVPLAAKVHTAICNTKLKNKASEDNKNNRYCRNVEDIFQFAVGLCLAAGDMKSLSYQAAID